MVNKQVRVLTGLAPEQIPSLSSIQLHYHFKLLCDGTDLAVRVNDLVVLIILNSFTKSGESGTST